MAWTSAPPFGFVSVGVFTNDHGGADFPLSVIIVSGYILVLEEGEHVFPVLAESLGQADTIRILIVQRQEVVKSLMQAEKACRALRVG